MLITDREDTDLSAWEAKNRRAPSVGDQGTHQHTVQSAFPATLGLESPRPAFTILPSLRSPGLVPAVKFEGFATTRLDHIGPTLGRLVDRDPASLDNRGSHCVEERAMKPWTVLHSQYISENPPYHRTRRDRVRLPNGTEFDYEVQEYPDWVNAVVLTPEYDIVLVFQYRHGIGDFSLEIPGGMAEPGEESVLGIIREVAEETGYRSPELPIFLGQFHPNPATSNNWVRSYLFLDAILSEGQHLDATEEIEIRLLPLKSYDELIHRGEAPQMFSAFAYHLARQYLARQKN